MNREEFKTWLTVNCESKSKKYLSDIVSRAERVERSMQKLDPSFTLEKEFSNDAGASLLSNLGRMGRNLLNSGIDLPVGTNQMFSIRASVSWYMRYLTDKYKN